MSSSRRHSSFFRRTNTVTAASDGPVAVESHRCRLELWWVGCGGQRRYSGSRRRRQRREADDDGEAGGLEGCLLRGTMRGWAACDETRNDASRLHCKQLVEIVGETRRDRSRSRARRGQRCGRSALYRGTERVCAAIHVAGRRCYAVRQIRDV